MAVCASGYTYKIKRHTEHSLDLEPTGTEVVGEVPSAAHRLHLHHPPPGSGTPRCSLCATPCHHKTQFSACVFEPKASEILWWSC